MNKKYEKGWIAVDAVIFTIYKGAVWVYLEKRDKAPFKSKLELPGGLLLPGETAEETLHRKLRGTLGDSTFFTQFYTFTEPLRDPRERAISIGFIALIPSDRVDINLFFRMPANKDLAFDHYTIVNKAFSYLKDNLDTKILRHFMPKTFPLNDLQKVHQSITGQALDNRNFRKKTLASGMVRKVNIKQKDVAHRPAELYKFKI